MPATERIADSMLVVLRSGSLCSAISRTCFLVTLPTLFLFGSPEPLSIFAAFLRRIDAGGVLVMNVKRAVRVRGDEHRDDQVAHAAPCAR